MQIILQEDIDKLGHRGDIVTVKPGYARNFLLPRKLAIEATSGNMKAVERIRASLAKKTATELDAAQKQAALLNGVGVRFTRKTGENDQLFGPSPPPTSPTPSPPKASRSTSARSSSRSPSAPRRISHHHKSFPRRNRRGKSPSRQRSVVDSVTANSRAATSTKWRRFVCSCRGTGLPCPLQLGATT